MNGEDARSAGGSAPQPGEPDPKGQAPDENGLIEAAKRDPLHFAALYEGNFARVYGYIARRVSDRVTAEDLTADVFHQALAALPRFEWRGVPFSAWLIRIAGNVIADRSKRSQKEHDLLTASHAANPEFDPGAGALAEIEELERRSRLNASVSALPEDQRRVILMRFVEEKSIREIAGALGRSEGAVKQLQFRGLQNLRSQLGHQAGEKNV